MKIILSLALVFCSLIIAKEPLAVYLTWQKNPESTMVIQCLAEEIVSTVYYQQKGMEEWHSAELVSTPLPSLPGYLIHQVELTSLNSASEYVFYFENTKHSFRTMPDTLDAPLNFVVGGDTYPSDLHFYIRTCRQAAKTDPSFALIGGDLAYTIAGRGPELTGRWIKWLTTWSDTMIRSDGCHIPLIPAIGNHDATMDNNDSFFTIFAFPGRPGYAALDFCDYLSLFILDTGHVNPVTGVQTEWLKSALEQRDSIPNKFALYHFPAYPSMTRFNRSRFAIIRNSWCPLFGIHHLTAAFEHHDHAYKRTHLMDNGVLYLGDGGWGEKNPRRPRPRHYIAHSASYRHFIKVTLQPDGTREFRATADNGTVFDTFILPAS